MPRTTLVNRTIDPPRFVELSWLDEPYFYAARREGEIGSWGEWEMYDDESYAPWDMAENWSAIIADLQATLGNGWEVESEAAHASIEPTSALLEQIHGVALPERLARFFDSGEWREHQGAKTVDPPMWSTSFEVRFDNLGVHLHVDLLELEEEQLNRFVPLSPLIGGDTQEYLAADVTSSEVPIFMWYHGSSTFYAYHDSLDDFLEALE